MAQPPPQAWKLMLAILLCGVILASAFAHAPRHRASDAELRRLVLSSLGLYVIGGIAFLAHHPLLAGLVFASGISISALAGWLSRGSGPEGPPDDEQPEDEHPPPAPDDLPPFDWGAFERELRNYLRERELAGRR
jgi:predicted membrane protein